MKPLKTKVSITLDIDLVEQLKGLAEADDRSFSQYVNLCLKECLASKVNKRRAIRKGQGIIRQIYRKYLLNK